MAETTAPTDTLTDIHDAVGGLLDASDTGTTSAASAVSDEEAEGDAAILAELEGSAVDPVADPPEELAAVVADPVPVVEEKVPDPLPLTYTVDGETRTFQGGRIVVDKDGSPQHALVSADRIKDLQYQLQRSDYLETQNRALYAEKQQFDRVEFKGKDGTTHTGLPAVEQYAVENAKLGAAVRVLAETIESPEKLIALAYAVQNGDTTELNRLTREIGLVAKEATLTTREQWSKRSTQVQQESTQHAAQQATVDQQRSYALTTMVPAAVQEFAKQSPALTPADLQSAIAYVAKFPDRFIRPSTASEAKEANVTAGDLIVDFPLIHQWLVDRAQVRAETTHGTSAALKAEKENAAKLAATKPGPKPGTKSPGTSTKAKPKATGHATVPADTEETWSQQRDRLNRGEFSAADDD